MPPDDELVDAAPCPNCRSPLTVTVADLGHLVECPNCATQFRARRTGAEPPPRRDEPRKWDDEDRDGRRPARNLDPFDDRDREDDRPRRRSQFDDRDYDDRRRGGTPGSVTAIAVMNFIYAGLLLLCGVLQGVFLAIGLDRFQFGGPVPNKVMEAIIMVAYLGTGFVMLFGGILALKRQGHALCVVGVVLAVGCFLLNTVNAVSNFRQGGFGGAGAPEEMAGLVCGIGFLVVFWFGYIITNGILLSKAARHFR